jgi:hypothetical protein
MLVHERFVSVFDDLDCPRRYGTRRLDLWAHGGCSSMNVSDFIAKWERVELTERSSAQQHFLDLCELVGHKKPADLDPTGESFTFERGATKRTGN